MVDILKQTKKEDIKMTFGEDYIGALMGEDYQEFVKRYRNDPIVNTLTRAFKQHLDALEEE